MYHEALCVNRLPAALRAAPPIPSGDVAALLRGDAGARTMLRQHACHACRELEIGTGAATVIKMDIEGSEFQVLPHL